MAKIEFEKYLYDWNGMDSLPWWFSPGVCLSFGLSWPPVLVALLHLLPSSGGDIPHSGWGGFGGWSHLYLVTVVGFPLPGINKTLCRNYQKHCFHVETTLGGRKQQAVGSATIS